MAPLMLAMSSNQGRHVEAVVSRETDCSPDRARRMSAMAEDGKKGIEQIGWTPKVEEPPCAGRSASQTVEIAAASARARRGHGKWSTRLRQGLAQSTEMGAAGRPATDATVAPSRDRHPLMGHAQHD
jgi:hypothetical protein